MKGWKEVLRDIKRKLWKGGSPDSQAEKPAEVESMPRQPGVIATATKEHTIPKRTGQSATVEPPPAPSQEVASVRSADPNKDMESASAPASSMEEIKIGGARNGSTTEDSVTDRRPASNATTSPLTFRPRIDLARPLLLPHWAEIGRALQHPDAGGRSPLSVRLGIDFGTAFTKVAIRAGKDLVVVDWSAVTGDMSASGCSIVPGFICHGSGGEFGWQAASGGEWHTNLKLPLVESRRDFPCPTATLAYLAEVIRYSRAFLYRHPEVGRPLANRQLLWELNIGCPTEPHESPEIVERFRHVARTAWRLAASKELTEGTILEAWRQCDLDTGLETDPGVVPEFVAQIAGYLKSPQVGEGLHALIDVGAATLDVATFNIVLPRHKDTPPKIPIFFSAVKPWGTYYLSHRRHTKLGLSPLWGDAAPVAPAAEFARRHRKVVSVIDDIDTTFATDAARCITGVIAGTRTSVFGDPHSRAWQEGLPVFFTGGGAACEVYRKVMLKSEETVKARADLTPRFKFIEMDLSRSMPRGIAPEAGTRLSVAVGLTEDAEDIARVVRQRDIEPITAPVRPRRRHEDIYGD